MKEAMKAMKQETTVSFSNLYFFIFVNKRHIIAMSHLTATKGQAKNKGHTYWTGEIVVSWNLPRRKSQSVTRVGMTLQGNIIYNTQEKKELGIC